MEPLFQRTHGISRNLLATPLPPLIGFATLDSTVKVIDPKTRPPVLLSDTVGFIDKLPHSLVASFRSTLAEVLEADLENWTPEELARVPKAPGSLEESLAALRSKHEFLLRG